MTTDPFPIEPKKRRIPVLDGAVFALAVAALAAPFVVRLIDQAQANTPQVALAGSVSAIRPIDIEMGHEEKRAEAAFFEGLNQPVQAERPSTLDLALAEPEPEVSEAAAKPLRQQSAEINLTNDLSLARYVQPRPMRRVAVIAAPGVVDVVLADDLMVTPDEVVEVPAPKIRVVMTVPPTITPLPSIRPRVEAPRQVEVASLKPVDPEVYIDPTRPVLSGAGSVVIDEKPLPPLAAAAPLPVPEVVVAMAEPVGAISALPLDVTPDEAQPAVPIAESPTVEPVATAPKITNGPRIALVIAAAGLNTNITRFAIEALPSGVTLAFAPIKPNAGALAAEAKADGHTVLVEIPMEPINQSRDPGPMTLRVGDTPAVNLKRLNQALARIPGADGASSYLGARFHANENAAVPVLSALADKGLFFFENEPTSRSVFQRIANRSNLPYARGVVKIDRDRSGVGIRAALNALEKEARQNGSAIGVGTTMRGTISTVALWAKEAEKRGVRLVPIIEIGR